MQNNVIFLYIYYISTKRQLKVITLRFHIMKIDLIQFKLFPATNISSQMPGIASGLLKLDCRS